MKKAMKDYECQYVIELYDKVPPSEVSSLDIWKKMVEHWDKPAERKKLDQAREARLSTANTPDGQITKSGFGRISASNRILREVKF